MSFYFKFLNLIFNCCSFKIAIYFPFNEISKIQVPRRFYSDYILTVLLCSTFTRHSQFHRLSTSELLPPVSEVSLEKSRSSQSRQCIEICVSITDRIPSLEAQVFLIPYLHRRMEQTYAHRPEASQWVSPEDSLAGGEEGKEKAARDTRERGNKAISGEMLDN